MSAPPASPQQHQQALLGYRTNEEWDALLAQTQAALDAVEAIADPDLRAQVMTLLDHVDSVHREALHRLLRLFKVGVLEQVCTDPAIHTLLELYDLLPAGAQDAARVPAPAPAPVAVPVKFMPKADWVRGAAVAASGPASAPPAAAVLPHWLPAPVRAGELAEGGTMMLELEAGPALLARVRTQVFAVTARCATDGQPMHSARLRHYTLVCPHHVGCFYDLRTGHRLGGAGAVQPIAVRVNEAGAIQLGIGVPYVSPVPVT